MRVSKKCLLANNAASAKKIDDVISHLPARSKVSVHALRSVLERLKWKWTTKVYNGLPRTAKNYKDQLRFLKSYKRLDY